MSVLLVVVVVAAVVATVAIAASVATQKGGPAQDRLRRVSEHASQRLTFRHPELTDRSFYLRMATDPVAAEANGWAENEVEVVAARFDDPARFARTQPNELVAIERETNRPVATVTITRSPLDPTARSAGVHVDSDHRGKGYGREAMAAAIFWLQQTPGAIHVGTRQTNVGMIRIMEQLGYEPFDSTTPYRAPDGEFYPAHWYQCAATER